MSLIGKLFEDASGNVVKVHNVEGTIAHLDSGQRIAIERLLDNSFYNEHIDPTSFGETDNNYYTFLGDQIKNIDVNNMGHIDTGIQVQGSNIPVVESHEDAQRTLKGDYTPSHAEYDDIEARKRQMMENAHNMSSKVESSNNKLKELIGEDGDEVEIQVNRNLEGVTMEGSSKPIVERRETSVTMLDEHNVEVNNYHNVPESNDKKENPIYTMFDAVKRSDKISITIKLDELIPKKDFIKMWEESYEISIIDHLADEFYKKLMKDPSIIRDQISDAVRKKVYPPKRTTKKPTAKRTKKPTTKK